MAAKISQKEYLKKYLSGEVGDEKKKKKKKRSKEIKGKTVTVVDDDIDLSQLVTANDDEIEAALQMNEEAPQIVGIIDERPAEMKAAELQQSGKWKGLQESSFESKSNGSEEKFKATSFSGKFKSKSSHRGKSPERNRDRKRPSPSPDLSPRRRERSVDLSPKRSRRKSSSDPSPLRRRRASPDPSPKRRNRSPDLSPKRRGKSSSDPSPPRRRQTSPDPSPPRRRRSSSDRSPKRRNRSPDLSPQRKRKTNHSPDLSPVRPKQRDRSPQRRKKSRWGASPDLSPERKVRSPDLSPVRHKPRVENSPKGRRSRDRSPPKKVRQHSPDLSPPRRASPPRKSRYNEGPSTSRLKREGPPSSYSRRKQSESPPPTHGKRPGKMDRTMDGKKAGLQDADNLKVENEKHRRREAEMYEQMSSEMSGRDAEARVRRTGAVDRRKLEENMVKEREREEKYQKRKEVYEKWGKGVKQVEDYEARLHEAAREMEKPLARYAGDEDLEQHLKQQDRIGDPMLDYIRSKRKETKIKNRVEEKPIYQGLFPDNRFNIRPGYRWDGVDRSNGYEKRLFEAINAREAMKEEAYRYSTEDM